MGTENTEIVIYHNDLASVPLRGFKASERKLLMTIFSKCKNRESDTVRIPFRELKKLSSYKATDQKRFIKDLDQTNSKLIQLNIRLNNHLTPNRIVRMTFFTRFVIDEEQKFLEVKVNPDFQYLLNNFTVNFTKFDLSAHNQLTSGYSMACFTQLKMFRTTGKWIVSFDDFKEIVDVPKSYRPSDIEKNVLDVILNELGDIFPNLEIEKTYAKTRGNPLTHLTFKFTPDDRIYISSPSLENVDVVRTSYVCPSCGQELIHKMINGSWCYCHADGWKQDAPCRKIFNSVAEINGYKEIPTRMDQDDYVEEQLDFTSLSNDQSSSFSAYPIAIQDILSKHLNTVKSDEE